MTMTTTTDPANRRAAINARAAISRILSEEDPTEILTRIAQAEIFDPMSSGEGREAGLNEVGNDSEDFFDCHVTMLRNALAAAYAAGRMESLR